MSDLDGEVFRTVQRFFSALQDGDMATCGELFTDDAVIWHNYDRAEQPKDEALAALGGLAHLRPKFDIVARELLPGGCVQQHVVQVSLPSGGTAAIPAVQRIYCDDGRITRIEEYMDSAQMIAAMRAMQDTS
jgi:ketosteroid isomerase-like protein